ncbi:MAG: leucyl aminopeptidase, partial [Gemmatimonadaceae bacterium]|nr:leucyl aminopeptidase [Gemmatimonadaceae bacterium]
MPLTLTVRGGDPGRLATPLLAVALPTGGAFPRALGALDAAYGGVLSKAVKNGDFKGGRDESLLVVGHGRGPARVLLLGLGDGSDAYAAIMRAATLAGRKANALGVRRMMFWSERLAGEQVEAAAYGLSRGSWDFTDYKTQPPAKDRPKPLVEAAVVSSDVRGSRGHFAAGVSIGEGQRLARRLQQLPGNVCTPEYLARTARDIAKRHRLRVQVFGRRDLRRMKMESFLAVAAGTPQDPKLIVLEYRGGRRGDAPVALVGKGLCFDSGGISIKPAQGMEMMKYDMSGAAGVLGAIEAIARMKLRVNVVGLIGSTTNMPSGTSMNPGDVVTASNGKTIEILNTDAEGRLVLADVLSYSARFKPAAIIDAATLTGACVIALGNSATGVMSNDDKLQNEVLAAAKRGGEPGWPLPMWDEYREMIKGDIADIKNIGGRGAGTITAALFLREFVPNGTPWVHLDIAGTAYSESDLTVIPKGPTGVPVRTFV